MGELRLLNRDNGDPVPALKSEEDAISTARTLAKVFAQTASARDLERTMPFAEMDALSRSGLLAITVPSEYGGLDVSNAVLAEVTAILAEADASIGQIPRTIFIFLKRCASTAAKSRNAFSSVGRCQATGSAMHYRKRAPKRSAITIPASPGTASAIVSTVASSIRQASFCRLGYDFCT